MQDKQQLPTRIVAPPPGPKRLTISSLQREYFRALDRERRALEECFAHELENEA